jgi:opacity protein-like surface antigen
MRRAFSACKSAFVAGACLPVCITAAVAAPPTPVIDGWAGPYIGAYFTAATGGRSQETSDQFTFSPRSTRAVHGDPSGNVTGSSVDLFAGRNWRFGNFVVGGQAEATISSNINLTNTGLYQATTTDRAGNVSSVNTNTSGTSPRLAFSAGLVGRAGFLARPDLLLYGLAGLEFGHFLFPDSDDQFGSANRSFVVGYTAGGGLEARYDDHWSVRAEYRFLHFGTSRSETANDTFLTIRRDNINMQTGKIGLVYRFGENGPLTAMAAVPRTSQQVWADSWAGPYAGIYFGAAAGHVAETFSSSFVNTQVQTTVFPPPGGTVVTTITNASTSTASMAGDVNASMTELFLGHNWRSGKVVAGVQAEGTLFSDVGFKAGGQVITTGTSSVNGVPVAPIGMVDIGSSNQKLRSTVGLIARAGFLASPDLLLYGLGGVEFGHFVYTVGTAPAGDNGKWITGVTAGAGAELRINDHWSLRGEYRYMHFDVGRDESRSSSSASSNSTSEGTSRLSRDTRLDVHVGKIGVVYKFGGGGPASAMAAIPSSAVARWSDGWAGPYFGVYFGAGAGATRGSFTGTSIDNNVGTVTTQNELLAGGMSGTQVDLFAGYNIRNDRLVVGAQAEVTQFSDVVFKTTGTMMTTTSGFPDASTQTLDYSQRLRSMASVVGRAGFLATPDLLLYGLGGIAFGHFTYPDGQNNLIDSDGKWATGYTVGGGAELKIAQHWSLRGEYRYLHFDIGSGGSFDRVNTPAFSNSNTFAYQTASNYHLGKIGLTYRIGEDPASAMAAMGGADACCDRWTGFSAGLYGAAGMGRVRDMQNVNSGSAEYSAPGVVDFGDTDSLVGTLAGDAKGGTVDLFAGYNWRRGRFVVGGQAEASVYADVGMKSRGMQFQTLTSLPAGPTTTGSGSAEYPQTLGSRAALIARAGFLATENLLLYGLAGAEFGHFEALDGSTFGGGDDGKWALGYTVGAGGELKLTDRWSLRGEYRYLRFAFDRNTSDDFGSSTSGIGFFTTLTTATRTRVDLNLAKLGVAYSFCYCE